MSAETERSSDAVSTRILAAAEGLIARGGVEAATTRAVAAAAGVQAPTIYRLFGGKDGLLDAVAEAALAAYVADKSARARDPDPVEELRHGWDRHVDFALRHPGIFAIMAARSDAARGAAVRGGLEVLRTKIAAVAAAGRLRMPEARALALFHGAADGIVSVLLRQDASARDMAVSHAAREAAIGAMTGTALEEVASGPPGAAAALRAGLSGVGGLSPGERLLLSELLDRIAGGHGAAEADVHAKARRREEK